MAWFRQCGTEPLDLSASTRSNAFGIGTQLPHAQCSPGIRALPTCISVGPFHCYTKFPIVARLSLRFDRLPGIDAAEAPSPSAFPQTP